MYIVLEYEKSFAIIKEYTYISDMYYLVEKYGEQSASFWQSVENNISKSKILLEKARKLGWDQ
mgnify:CR=1 FL=1